MNDKDKPLGYAILASILLLCFSIILLCLCASGCTTTEYVDRIVYEEVEVTVYDQAPPIETPVPPQPIVLTEGDTLKDILIKVKDYIFDLKRAYLEYVSKVDAHNFALESPPTPSG